MRVTVGVEVKSVAWENPLSVALAVQMVPSSIVAGNTGLVYGKFGSYPVADINSPTWDFVLNPGATDGTNTFETRDKALITKPLFLIADTADQVVNVTEVVAEVEKTKPDSGVVGG